MAIANTTLRVAASVTQTKALDLAVARMPLDIDISMPLGSGTGAGQADLVFADTRTLAASATEDLDLAGVLTDAFGATLTFARIKGIIVKAASGNTNNIVVGGAASNAWSTLLGATGTATVRPGGYFAAGASDATAYAVTAGTGDLLKIANSGSGTPVTYDIFLIGTSA